MTEPALSDPDMDVPPEAELPPGKTAAQLAAMKPVTQVQGRVDISGIELPNYRRLDETPLPPFDGTRRSHDRIVERNARNQYTEKLFSEQLKVAFAQKTPDEQVAVLLKIGEQDLSSKHILQVAQQLDLRGANDEALGLLDAKRSAAARKGSTDFFDSPEIRQWQATENHKAGHNLEAARLSDAILAGDPENAEAWRTKTMALVAEAGPNRAAALGFFEQGFAKTGDYSLGMGALNAALESGDVSRARALAPLVSLAAKNIGADQSKSFWPAVINAQATTIGGDEAETRKAMLHLVEVLDAKDENGTPLVSDLNKKMALDRIGKIAEAQGGKPEVTALLEPVAERLQMSLGLKPEKPLPYERGASVDEVFAERGYHSRQGLTPEGFQIGGNVRSGSMLPDSTTTIRDKTQFLEVAETPLNKFIESGLIREKDLPAGLDPTSPLSAISDLKTRIEATQTLVRGIFAVDERNLEDLHGLDHKIYDSVVRLRIAHSGATTFLQHLNDQEREKFAAISDNDKLIKAVFADKVTPEQRAFMAKLMPGEADPEAATKALIEKAQVFRGSDTRTNIGITAEQGIGDCRHVAAATEALVSAVQQSRTTDYIKQASQHLTAGDNEGFQRFSQAAEREMNGYEMRIYDQSVMAAVESPKLYNPVLTEDGRFVAAANNKPQVIETHMHNVLRVGGEGEASKYVVADSFYEKGPYKMGWVENKAPEVFRDGDMNKLRLNGGEIEAVVCEREPDGSLVMKNGHPVPLLDEAGKPRTVKVPLVLESTKYSSPGTQIKIGTPRPDALMMGVAVSEPRPRLAEALQDPRRQDDYVRQAKFVVNNHNTDRARSPELPDEELPAAKLRVAGLKKAVVAAHTAQRNAAAKPAAPADERHQPAAERHQPAAERHQPAAERHQPAAERHQPAAERHQPAAERHQPAAEPHQPAAERHQPAAERHQPAAERHQPAAEPRTAHKPPPPAERAAPPRERVPPPAEKPHGAAHAPEHTAPREKVPVVERAPVEEPHGGGGHGGIGAHGSNAVGAAGIALALAQRNYREATQSAVMQVALNPRTYEAAAELTKEIAPVAKALGFVGKKVPVLGTVITAGYVLYEVGSDVHDRNYGKAGAALAAGLAEAGGNLVGFGVGDLAREVVRQDIIETVGEKYAPNKSGIRQLAEGAYALGKKAVDDHNAQQHAQALHQHQPASVAPPTLARYKNLSTVGYVLKTTPSAALNGNLQRTPDGFIKNFAQLNMADPKNLKAYEEAIDRQMQKAHKTVDAGSSLLSSFMPWDDKFRRSQDATVELRQLQSAKNELAAFKRDLQQHHPQAAAPQHAATPAAASGAPPSFFSFKNLAAVGYVLKSTPSNELDGALQRTPDGFIKNFRQLNMADPKNIKAYEQAIDRQIKKTESTVQAGGSLVSSFMPGDKFRKSEDAKIELRQLQAAKAELAQYKKALQDHAHPAGHKPDPSRFHAVSGGTTTHETKAPPRPPAKPSKPAM